MNRGLLTRRGFVKLSAGAAAYGALAGAERAMAEPLGLPLGLQLYTVRALLPKDYAGTLQQLGAMGYREVEAAGFYNHSAADVKQAMGQAGLHCVSSHYPLAQLGPQLDEVIRYGSDLGLEYIVCSSPTVRDPGRVQGMSWAKSLDAMSLDDWRWNADQLNQIGKRVHAAGMKFAYHNHYVEFHPHDGVIPYDQLLRWTDPASVAMEMDCGWVVIGGKRPEDYLARYPERFVMLHLKEFKLEGWTPGMEPVSTEMGRGSIDYRKIFAAAKNARIRHMFVEQEAFPDMPAIEALKANAAYLQSVTV